jgi:ABC-type branched-subunit amino acid transport system substrate-binding protein
LNNRRALAIALLVTGLIVGGGIGYYAAPTKIATKIVPTTIFTTEYYYSDVPLRGRTITLGYIASSNTTLETAKPLLEQIVIPDINKQMKALGWDPPTFQILIDNADGKDETHLEKVQGFRSIGVTVFQTSGWSSQITQSLSYVNMNKMLMWSSNSTTSTLAIANDSLFRMCPSDYALAPALVNVMWSYGIKDVIIFQRGDELDDGIVNVFIPAWTAKGGSIVGDKIRYNRTATDFTSYLQLANTEAQAAVAKEGGNPERVGVLLLSSSEFSTIAKQAQFYYPFYMCPFFGGSGTANSQLAMAEAPYEVNHMRVFSLVLRDPESSLFNSLKTRYESLTKQQFTAFPAYVYDVESIIANSMIMAQSDQAVDIQPLQIPLCDSTFGVSGWLKLNQYGDRVAQVFNVWFYAPRTGTSDVTTSVSYVGGVYNSDTSVVTWDNSALQQHLGYMPLGPKVKCARAVVVRSICRRDDLSLIVRRG